MNVLLALALLAATGAASLSSPWPLLAIAFVGGVGLWRERSRASLPPLNGSAHETVVATLYLRKGSLRLRRRAAHPEVGE